MATINSAWEEQKRRQQEELERQRKAQIEAQKEEQRRAQEIQNQIARDRAKQQAQQQAQANRGTLSTPSHNQANKLTTNKSTLNGYNRTFGANSNPYEIVDRLKSATTNLVPGALDSIKNMSNSGNLVTKGMAYGGVRGDENYNFTNKSNDLPGAVLQLFSPQAKQIVDTVGNIVNPQQNTNQIDKGVIGNLETLAYEQNIGGALQNTQDLLREYSKLVGANNDANVNKELDKIVAKSDEINTNIANKLDSISDPLRSKYDDTLSQLGYTVGQQLPNIALGMAAGGVAGLTGASASTVAGISQGVGLGSMGASVYGNSTQQALDNGANWQDANAYGVANTFVEIATELMSPGIPGFSQVDLFGEGAEEFISGMVDPFLEDIYNYQPDSSLGDYATRTWNAIPGALEDGVMGIVSAGVLDVFTGGKSIKAVSQEVANSINQDKLKIANLTNQKVTEVTPEQAQKVLETAVNRAKEVQKENTNPDILQQTKNKDLPIKTNSLNSVDQATNIIGKAINQVQQHNETLNNVANRILQEQKTQGLQETLNKSTNQIKDVITEEEQANTQAINQLDNVVGEQNKQDYLEEQRKELESLGFLDSDTIEEELNNYSAKWEVAKNSELAIGLLSTNPEVREYSQKANQQIIENSAKQYNVSKKQVKLITQVANKLGIEVEFTDTLPEGVEGQQKGSKIYISNKTINPVMSVVGHELTHTIENSSYYNDYVKSIEGMLSEKGYTLEGAQNLFKKKYQEKYAEQGLDFDMTDEDITSETIAILTQDIISDENSLKYLARNNTSLATKILEFLDRISQKLQGTYDATIDNARKTLRQALQSNVNTEVANNTTKNAFGGINARTLDNNMYNLAQQMENDGASKQDIWEQTGFVKKADGKWRFEIDDSKSTLNEDIVKSAFTSGNIYEITKLKDLYNNKNLYKAYPEVNDLMVIFSKFDLDTSYGEYSPEKNTITLYTNNLKGKTLNETIANVKETLNHEVQHSIQNIEGFVGGSNLQKAQQSLVHKQNDKFRQDYDKINNLLKTAKNNNNVEEIEKLENELNSIDYNWNHLESPTIEEIIEEYKNNLGEVEARDSSSRMNLTKEQRKALLPETEGTKYSKGINTNELDNLRPDGTRKDLQAVHNISADKLNKAFELGGFPMPSIAITKDSLGHNGFGDISLVFDKNSIDPAYKNNKVYERDAWTSTYPDIDYEINDKELSKAVDSIKSILGKDNVEKLQFDNSMFNSSNIAYDLSGRRGDVGKIFNNNDLLKYAFLKDTGNNIEMPYEEEKLSYYAENEEIKDFSKMFDNISNNEFNKLITESTNDNTYFEKYGIKLLEARINNFIKNFKGSKDSFILAGYKNELAKLKNNDFYNEYMEGKSSKYSNKRIAINIAKAIVDYREGNIEKVLDTQALNDIIRTNIKQGEYENWIRQKFGNIVANKGIYKLGVEPYKYNGDRKSFKQTHDSETLDNVVKNMKKKNLNNDFTPIWSSTELLPRLSKNYKSLQDIIDNENRLGNDKDTQYGKKFDEVRNEFRNYIDEINNDYIEKTGNNSVRNGILNVLDMYLRKAKSPTDLMNKINRNGYIWKISEEQANKIYSMKQKMAELPTDYFEAKPERAVSFDEVKQAVVPMDKYYDEIAKKLEDKGIEVKRYDPDVYGDRQAKIDERNDLKFSKGLSPELKKYSNQELNKRVNAYKSLRENVMTDIFGRGNETFNGLINTAAYEILEDGNVSEDTRQSIIKTALSEGGTLVDNDVNSEIRNRMSGKVFKVEPGAYKDAGYDSALKMNNDFAKYGVKFSQTQGETLDQFFNELVNDNLGVEEVYPRDQIPYLKNILSNTSYVDKLSNYLDENALTEFIDGTLEDFKNDINLQKRVVEEKKSSTSQKIKPLSITNEDGIIDTEKAEIEKGNYVSPDEYANYTKNIKRRSSNNIKVDTKVVGKDLSFSKVFAKQMNDNIRNLAALGKDYSTLNKTVDQMGDVIANGDESLQKAWKETISEPLYNATGSYSASVESTISDVYDKLVKELGIKKGSKDAQGLMWYAEKAKPTGKNGETTEYGLADLKADFPKSWQNIVEGEKYTHELYDEYFERINNALESIYPEEQLTKEIAKARQGLDTELEDKKARLKELKNNPFTDIDQIKKYEKDIAKLSKQYNETEKTVKLNKRLPYRADYMRHFQELSNTQSLKDIIKGKTQTFISNDLAGISEGTKPNSKWESFMQERKGGAYTDDAIASLLAYIPSAEYKINIDPYTAYLRGVTQEYVHNSNELEVNNGGTIRYLSNLANDLAGKTNPIDRVLNNFTNGRKLIRMLGKFNSRVKGNAVMGNLNSAVSQFYNLPNAVAVMSDKGGAKSSIDWAKGMATMSQDFTKPYSEKIIADSPFMIQRYGIDDVMSKFDDSVMQTPRKMAKWLMTYGDKVVAQQTWYAAYEQAERLGVDNPIFYADDITRRSVAGRGIGEVPLSQKSEIVKLIAPFQVEVNNQWQVMKHLLTGGDKKKPLNGLVGLIAMAVVSWLMNNVNESVTGRRVGFDPIDAITSPNGNNSTVGGRLVGNVISNMPMGTQISSMLGNEQQLEQLFGSEDPTRYGTGNIGIQALVEPVADAFTGTPYKLSKTFNYLLPFGGKQAERTYNYLADKGIVPDASVFGENLVNLDTKEGAYNAKGNRLKYTIDNDVLNNIRGAMFGSSATTQGQEFSNAYDRGEVPILGTNQTKYYELLGGGYDVYNAIQNVRQAEKHIDNDGNTITNSLAAESRKSLEDSGLYSDVMDKIASGELPQNVFNLNKTVEGWSQEEFDNFYNSLNDYQNGNTTTIETPKSYSTAEQNTVNRLSDYGVSDDVARSIVSANDTYTKNVVNTDTGKSIANSKAALTRQKMIEDGSYQTVIDYLNSDENLKSDDPLKPSDFGLNKTIVNMSSEEYEKLLKEIEKYYSEETKNETSRVSKGTDYSKFFASM